MFFFKKKKEDNLLPPDLPNEKIESTGRVSINEQLKELNDKLDVLGNIGDKKEKKAKLKGFSHKKLKRLNKAKRTAVFMLRRTGSVELIKGELTNGMIKVNENYYDGSAIYVWLFKHMNKLIPFYIIPEWSIRPLARDEIYKKSIDEKTLIDSQVITLRAMKMEQVAKQDGKKMGGWLWIGIAIAAAVIAFIIFGGKK